jgi:16S rRNA (guanine527-N7)-methyltransferase
MAVATRDLPSRIARRATKVGAAIPAPLARQLAAYLELLARWNRKINLTGLRVDPPDEEAIDRLVIEPVAAAKFLAPEDRVALDVGSGGGSPALPLKLAVPRLRFVLVESKVRKAAFLREAVRELGLEDVRVENRRLEDLEVPAELADVATLRAVRIDRGLTTALGRFVRPGGRVFAFGADELKASEAVAAIQMHVLVAERRSHVFIFRPEK